MAKRACPFDVFEHVTVIDPPPEIGGHIYQVIAVEEDDDDWVITISQVQTEGPREQKIMAKTKQLIKDTVIRYPADNLEKADVMKFNPKGVIFPSD